MHNQATDGAYEMFRFQDQERTHIARERVTYTAKGHARKDVQIYYSTPKFITLRNFTHSIRLHHTIGISHVHILIIHVCEGL